MDSSDKLGQLRIDRNEPPPSGSGKTFLVVGIVAALALGVGAWMYFGRGTTWTVATAMAQPVTTASAATSAGGSVLDATGYVTARRQATVSAKVTGRVAEVMIEEGQKVEEGQVLARLEAIDAQAQLDLSRSQLDAARALLTEQRVQLAQADRDLKRQNDMYARKLTSQQASEDAATLVATVRARIKAQETQVQVAQRGIEVNQVQLDNTVVTAPFSGVITVKAAQPGEIVSPISAGGGFTRTGIGTIVDMGSLEIEVDVNESYIGRVKAGQPVESTLNAYPDWKIPGKVIAIIPTADRSKATVKVRISIDAKDDRIVPDMGARVAFMEEKKVAGAPSAPPQALPGALVPGAAVVSASDGSVVYVVKNGKAEQRKVSVGQTMGASRQILSGIAVGEQVAVSPPDGLKSGDRVATN
ncbi:MAG TPA: efflux RND transporter periplasmic adaptor subunit [Tahibacter sp.]|nr:efflux RND transporter periplasmic adaptor subunit [Tahibacter sp.]